MERYTISGLVSEYKIRLAMLRWKRQGVASFDLATENQLRLRVRVLKAKIKVALHGQKYNHLILYIPTLSQEYPKLEIDNKKAEVVASAPTGTLL